MDSPLLPTLRQPSSPSALLEDLTLDPMSPGASFTDTPPRHLHSTTHSLSHSSLSSSSVRDEGVISSQITRGPSKPRFSLFAPHQPQPQSQQVNLNGSQQQASNLNLNGSQQGNGNGNGYGMRSTSTISESEEKEDEDGHGEEQGQHEDEQDHTIHPSTTAMSTVTRAQRDDKLRESLYELRGMNEVFEGFLSALEAARGHNQRLAERVSQTSALLDEYTALLGQAEHTQQLLSNPNWTGAEDDAQALQAEEAARQAAAAQAEQEARRAEDTARAAAGERDRVAREAAQRQAVSSTRGGTRGRGGRGTGIPAPSMRQPSAKKTTPPGTGSAPSGIQKPSAGLGGRYADVKSSGYGPAARR
ncbi:DASH complex subunit Duo1-domain-containing protein [Naematelia encephala]|uniref:DASH complex subunit DUO1 n=1 Tax=Naematelia encephala TaxID=71784 RepID=A0A1Y2AS05_9TREE|nr:DASH complex subunit Duo1-domain-containing protein [Naematelia encephala]